MKNEIQKYLLKDIAAIIAGQSPESKSYLVEKKFYLKMRIMR